MTTTSSPSSPSPPQLLIQDTLVVDSVDERTESSYDSDGSFDHILAFDELNSPTSSFVEPNDGREGGILADGSDFEYLHPIDWDAGDGEMGKPVLVVEDEPGEADEGLDEQGKQEVGGEKKEEVETTVVESCEKKEEAEKCVVEKCEKEEEIERVDTLAFQDLPSLRAGSDSETDTEPLIYGPLNRPTHTHPPAFFTFLPPKGVYIPRFKPQQESAHLQEPFHLFFPMALENLNLKQLLMYTLLPTLLAIYALALNLLPSQKLPTASEWKPRETIKVVTITEGPKSVMPGLEVEVKITKGTPVPSGYVGGCLRPDVKLEEMYTPPRLKRQKGIFGEVGENGEVVKPREKQTLESKEARTKNQKQQVQKAETGKKARLVEKAKALMIPLVQTRGIIAYQTYKDVLATMRSEKKVQVFRKPKKPSASESATPTQVVESSSPKNVLLLDSPDPLSSYFHQKGLKMKKVVKKWKDEVIATVNSHNASSTFSSAATTFGCAVWNWTDAAFMRTAGYPGFQQAQVKFETFREEAKKRYSIVQEHAMVSSKGVIMIRAQQTSLIVQENVKLASESLKNSAKGVRERVEGRFAEGMKKEKAKKSLDLWKGFALSLKEQAASSSKDLMARTTNAQQQTSLIVQDNFKKVSEGILKSAKAMGESLESRFAEKMKRKAKSLDMWKAFAVKKFEDGRCMLERMGGVC
ncbi:hypothetical protein HDV05_008575 [Chytridiales sp. JEL 0842]|nr:hypothetical protein HDV05_008575 [Chytridiales sp. JEL 0842]